MKSATDNKIRELTRQLEAEKIAHAVTRNQLQAQINTVWRLVPSSYLNLMGVYPSLRRLLHVLGEAADLQDPTTGAPVNDSTHTGTELTSVERAVLTHRQHRANVTTINTELDWFTHKISKLTPGQEAQYNPPDGTCPECGTAIFQKGVGRWRVYCSTRCRQKATKLRTA